MTQASCAVFLIIFLKHESYDTPAELVASARCIVVTAITLGTVIPSLLEG